MGLFPSATDPPFVPTLAPSGSVTTLYDFAVNGVGYMVAWEIDRELLSPWKVAYEMDAPDLDIERTDFTATEITENKLDTMWWMDNRSWEYGAGQMRYDKSNSSYPSDRAYFDSSGVDTITTPGQAQLLAQVSQVHSLSNTISQGAPAKAIATNSQVFVAVGQPNVAHFSALNGSDWATQTTGTSTAQQILDMATDGQNVYLALGPDGITENNGTTSTVQESFDSAAGWSTTSGTVTIAADTVDFVQGVASLEVTQTSASQAISQKTEVFDLSAAVQIKLQMKQTPVNAGGTPFLVSHLAEQFSSGNASHFGLGTLNAGDFILCRTLCASGTLTVTGTNVGSISNLQSNTLHNEWNIYTVDSNYYSCFVSANGNTELIFSTANMGQAHAEVLIFRNVNQTTPIDSSAYTNLGASLGTSISTGALTITQPNEVMALFWSSTPQFGSSASNRPTLFGGSPPGTFVDDDYQGSAGGFTSATATWDSSTSPAIGTFNSLGPMLMNTQSYSECGIFAIMGAQGPLVTMEQRLLTSVGNYFTRTVTPSTTSWFTDLSVPSAWTAVGSPAWNNITALVLVQPVNSNGYVFHYDDLEWSSPGTFGNIQASDARVLGWAKDRLYAAGIQSGSTWQFYEVGLGGGSNRVWLILPVAGFTVTQICELGGFVYFSAVQNSRSQIYAFDGATTPYIAGVVPPGEVITMMSPFLNAGLLVATRRPGSYGAAAGQGVLYRAFPDSTGHVTLEQIALFGADDGRDYSPHCAVAYQDFIHFGYSHCAPATFGPPALVPTITPITTGLGIYSPATGGYSRHLEAIGDGVTVACVVFSNRRIFTTDGGGVFVEQSTYVPTGYIISSIYDWNIDGPKQLMLGEEGSMPLPAGTQIEIDYSSDQGATWVQVVTSTTTNSTQGRGTIFVPANIAQCRAILRSDPSQTQTPVLKKAGLAAIYGQKPRRIWKIATKAYNRISLRNRAPYPGSGPALAANIESRLQALHDNQTIVTFQAVGYGEEHFELVTCRISAMRVLRQFQPQTGWANLIMLQITEVPTS